MARDHDVTDAFERKEQIKRWIITIRTPSNRTILRIWDSPRTHNQPILLSPYKEGRIIGCEPIFITRDVFLS